MEQFTTECQTHANTIFIQALTQNILSTTVLMSYLICLFCNFSLLTYVHIVNIILSIMSECLVCMSRPTQNSLFLQQSVVFTENKQIY